MATQLKIGAGAKALDELHYTLCTMQAYGGGFVAKLADAWMAADATNSAKLRAAFPELLVKYGPESQFYRAHMGDREAARQRGE